MSAASEFPAKRVLLVDDEPAVIHVTRRMLEIGGYVVTSATSPVEGLRLFETQAWDLVITDRSMPVMDGEQLAALIRERTPQLPILMVTGFPESVIHPEVFVAVLRKPFSPVDLLAHVARALGKEA